VETRRRQRRRPILLTSSRQSGTLTLVNRLWGVDSAWGVLEGLAYRHYDKLGDSTSVSFLGGGAVMRMRITSRLLAWAITQLLLTAGTNFANTVNVVNDGFGAYDVATVWGGGEYGTDMAAGVYTLTKTGDSGIGSTWHNGPIAGFCVELNEAAPTETLRYAVGMPDDMVVSYTGETLGTTKSTYLRELWARYYDPSWSLSGASSEVNRSAAAFAAAVWEIVYENAPGSGPKWDVTADGTAGLGGFLALNIDAATANKWLQNLTGCGPKADLRVFVNDGGQNYLVAVPEPATLVLLGLGGLCSILRRRTIQIH